MSEPTYDEVMRENQERWVEYLMNWMVLTLNESYPLAVSTCWFLVGPYREHILDMKL